MCLSSLSLLVLVDSPEPCTCPDVVRTTVGPPPPSPMVGDRHARGAVKGTPGHHSHKRHWCAPPPPWDTWSLPVKSLPTHSGDTSGLGGYPKLRRFSKVVFVGLGASISGQLEVCPWADVGSKLCSGSRHSGVTTQSTPSFS